MHFGLTAVTVARQILPACRTISNKFDVDVCCALITQLDREKRRATL